MFFVFVFVFGFFPIGKVTAAWIFEVLYEDFTLISAVIKEKYLILVIRNLLVLEVIFLLEFSGRLWSKFRDRQGKQLIFRLEMAYLWCMRKYRSDRSSLIITLLFVTAIISYVYRL